MTEEAGRKFEFPPDDKIDNSSYELVQRVFGVDGALLTNESTLYDFEDLPDELPGHNLVRLSDVPLLEREGYKGRMPDFAEPERYLVWYPPLTEEEQTELDKEARRKLLSSVESAYEISFAKYPEEQGLHIWKVAEYIQRSRLEQFKK